MLKAHSVMKDYICGFSSFANGKKEMTIRIPPEGVSLLRSRSVRKMSYKIHGASEGYDLSLEKSEDGNFSFSLHRNDVKSSGMLALSVWFHAEVEVPEELKTVARQVETQQEILKSLEMEI